MEIKSNSNLSNMEQKELSKLSNGETIVIKAVNKGIYVLISETVHYQSMIMYYLLQENACKKTTLASRKKYRVTF